MRYACQIHSRWKLKERERENDGGISFFQHLVLLLQKVEVNVMQDTLPRWAVDFLICLSLQTFDFFSMPVLIFSPVSERREANCIALLCTTTDQITNIKLETVINLIQIIIVKLQIWNDSKSCSWSTISMIWNDCSWDEYISSSARDTRRQIGVWTRPTFWVYGQTVAYATWPS